MTALEVLLNLNCSTQTNGRVRNWLDLWAFQTWLSPPLMQGHARPDKRFGPPLRQG